MEYIQKYSELALNLETLNKLIDEDPIIDWKQSVFSFLPEDKLKYLSLLPDNLSDPFIYFVRGLINEEGIYKEKDMNKAIILYKKGVELNDPYCNYRLYYHYRNNNYDKVVNEDYMIHLIRAFAYFDETEDQRFIINPIESFKKILVLNPNYIDTLKSFFKESTDCEMIFLKNVLNFKLMNKTIYLNIKVEDNNLFSSIEDSIVALAENTKKHNLSCLFLATYYYYYEDLNDTALELLEVCYKNNITQCYYLYSKCLWEAHKYDLSLSIMKQGVDLGCFKCYNILASQVINNFVFNNRVPSSYIESFKLFMKAAILGDFWAYDYAFFIFTHILKNGAEEYKEFYAETEKSIYEFSERIYISYKSFSCINTDFTEHGGQYYLLGYCLMKGIGCKPNLKRSIEVLSYGLTDNVITNLRVIYRYLWKAYKTIDDKLNSEKYLSLYISMINKLERRYPQHTYFISKYYFNGTGVEKDIIKSYDYCEEGAKFKEDYMFFCPIYYKEKSILFKKEILKDNEEMINSVIKSRTICLECKEKVRITIFFPCKHKTCCLDCGSKLFGQNKNCNQCDTPIEFIINAP